MKKWIALVMVLALALAMVPAVGLAEEPTPVGDMAELAAAVAKGGYCKLTADIAATGTITIDKDVTLDLNGHNICVPGQGSNNILVTAGTFTITGTGKIYEKEGNRWFGAIIVKAAEAVTIGENVTLEGCMGLMLPAPGESELFKPIITMNGTIRTYNDRDGASGSGLYVNGTNKNKTEYAKFNIGSTAVITSTGPGIYGAGYAEWNIVGGAQITGVASGIAMKAGKLNISGGTIKATGAAVIPPAGWNTGINGSGCAIQIESNSGYASDIIVNISGGTFTSENGYAIYEYIASGESSLESLDITGGTFLYAQDLDNFMLLSEAGKTKATIATDAIVTGNGGTEVKAEVEPTFTIIIPAAVDFGKLTPGTGTAQQNFPVKAEGLFIEDGKQINVSLKTLLPMKAGVVALPYTLENSAAQVSAGNEFTSFTANRTENGFVKVDRSLITKAGAYRGTMTFTIAYVTAPVNNP